MPDYHPDGRREQIHVARPSVLPFTAALGITIALMGLILSWWIVGLGGLILLVTVVLWIQGAREDFDSLPSERK
jgi:hypothetical protein